MATPEELAARYVGRWVISHDLHWDGTDEWIADPSRPGEDERFSARSIDLLAERLACAVGGGRRG